MTIKQCKCGCTCFELEVDDCVVKICCIDCSEVYFHDEIGDLENASM